MKQPIFVTGNLNKVEYLAKAMDIQFEHHHLDLDEIQSADPRKVAEHKARQAYQLLQKPVLIEDTSVSFVALHGLPGPFIKFFVDLDDGLEKLCRMLDGFTDRSVYAVGTYAYYDGEELAFFEGRLDGVIVDHPRGSGGFGWDQIFEPLDYKGQTRAELTPEQYILTYKKIRDLEGLRAFLVG